MNAKELSRKVWQEPYFFIAFGFGSGLMPIAPGTWGTFVAIFIYLLMAKTSFIVYLLITFLAFTGGILITHHVSRELGEHDFGGIVWDEIVGYLVTMMFVPVGIGWVVAGFLLFRLFDIWKPQPIRLLDQHLKGGIGIMLDDVLAGILAGICLQVVMWGFNS